MSKYSYEPDILPDNYSLQRFIHLAAIQGVDMIGKNLPKAKMLFLTTKKGPRIMQIEYMARVQLLYFPLMTLHFHRT